MAGHGTPCPYKTAVVAGHSKLCPYEPQLPFSPQTVALLPGP
jgi:hypothetical protein